MDNDMAMVMVEKEGAGVGSLRREESPLSRSVCVYEFMREKGGHVCYNRFKLLQRKGKSRQE